MKKYTFVFALFAMMALTACGNGSTTTEKTDSTTNQTDSVTTTTNDSTAVSTEALATEEVK
jgi:ABC-type enterochelin transport system substrate-binding protein